jgi:hypothetical protein
MAGGPRRETTVEEPSTDGLAPQFDAGSPERVTERNGDGMLFELELEHDDAPSVIKPAVATSFAYSDSIARSRLGRPPIAPPGRPYSCFRHTLRMPAAADLSMQDFCIAPNERGWASEVAVFRSSLLP